MQLSTIVNRGLVHSVWDAIILHHRHISPAIAVIQTRDAGKDMHRQDSSVPGCLLAFWHEQNPHKTHHFCIGMLLTRGATAA